MMLNVHELRNGDEVYWNDPDGGLCSRHIVIREIRIDGEVVVIDGIEGDHLECLVCELS
jgi:hypothetical protein